MIPESLLQLFIEAIMYSWNAFYRERFEAQGIATAEKRRRSPNPLEKDFMETLPVRERIEKYIETLDLTKREDVAKLMPIINETVGSMRHHPSGLFQKIMAELAVHGMDYRDGKVAKATP